MLEENLQKVEVVPVTAVNRDCSAPASVPFSTQQPRPFLAFTGPECPDSLRPISQNLL